MTDSRFDTKRNTQHSSQSSQHVRDLQNERDPMNSIHTTVESPPLPLDTRGRHTTKSQRRLHITYARFIWSSCFCNLSLASFPGFFLCIHEDATRTFPAMLASSSRAVLVVWYAQRYSARQVYYTSKCTTHVASVIYGVRSRTGFQSG